MLFKEGHHLSGCFRYAGLDPEPFEQITNAWPNIFLGLEDKPVVVVLSVN